MFLHLGQDTVINDREIIGIFDMDKTTISKATRKFLSQAQKNGKIKEVSYEIPKTFILSSNKKSETVYLSQISTATLCKRAEDKTLALSE
ncbi:MAG: DUF370 domain-containing protein [Ruminococcaceae bacterium]|nr:DUF370 domain-containing protein [Oscillospiraceae bacterium]